MTDASWSVRGWFVFRRDGDAIAVRRARSRATSSPTRLSVDISGRQPPQAGGEHRQTEATRPVAISPHPTTNARLTVHYWFLAAKIGTPRRTFISRSVPM